MKDVTVTLDDAHNQLEIARNRADRLFHLVTTIELEHDGQSLARTVAAEDADRLNALIRICRDLSAELAAGLAAAVGE